MALRPVTVSQLNEYINRVLTTDPLLGNISVKGEISNLKYHGSGHVYFSMVDESAKINCFFASSYVKNLPYELSNGAEVVVNGYINVYKKGGTYTLFVKNVDVSGKGNLSTVFDLLKNKLQQEGLFDSKYKKAIPPFPEKVGILTSDTGAAVEDIIKIIKSRTAMTDVMVFPVLVQGFGAAEDIAYTIEAVNKNFPDIDVLIVGRGGGSAEDLRAFNEEILARAVFASQIPIISAVGHETDFSICDFVADLRAETPTAAAEKAVPDDMALIQALEGYKQELNRNLNNRLAYLKLWDYGQLSDMRNTLLRKIDALKHTLEKQILTLDENNPSNILSKGYGILQDFSGKIISSGDDIRTDTQYRLHLKDGIYEITLSKVSKIEREGEGS